MEDYSHGFQNHEYYPMEEDCLETFNLLPHSVTFEAKTGHLYFKQPCRIIFFHYRLMSKLYDDMMITSRTLDNI
jgi:hypothetical protein